MKVFKMNDFDWVAAESLEQAKNWYKKETGIDDSEMEDVVEVPLTDTVWVEYDKENCEKIKETITRLGNGNKKLKYPNLGWFKLIGETLLKRETFAKVLENTKTDVPFIISSTEW